MKPTKIDLDEWFKYHPVMTEERRLAHNTVNAAAQEFAEVIMNLVDDEECLKMAFYAVQQARMFANQGITLKETQGE